MRRTNRLASAGQIRRVYASGRRAQAAFVGCAALVEPNGPPQVAVVAGRRVGGAVARNRAKRRLRAAIGPLVPRMSPGAKVVVGATTRTIGASFHDLEEQVAKVLSKAGVLDDA